MSAWSVIGMAKRALADEVFAVAVYSRLAKLYSIGSVRLKLTKISEMEMRHAGFWSEFLSKRGYDVSSVKVNKLKVFLYIAFLRLLGFSLTLRMLERSERILHHSQSHF